jgi:hypothetical protein
MSAELVRYDAMCSAIAECHRVDEVADIKNKARALELYAAQCKNTDAERRASEVRLRAERRTGELLKELAKATPADAGKAGGHAKAGTSNDATRQPTPYADALQRTGISRQSANRYEALANVPKETFEAALREPVKPTTTAILEKAKAHAVVREARDPQPRMPADSLWLWGRMNDFERDGYHRKDPAALLEQMTEAMRADVLRIAPLMAEFFGRIKELRHEPA